MMFGSLFYNFWAALLSFAVYFIWAIQNPYAMPLQTIGISFVVAAVGFCLMYIVRSILGYVFYTPETIEYTVAEDENIVMMENDNSQQSVPQSNRSTAENEVEIAEDVAQVVRTMLHGDEALSR